MSPRYLALFALPAALALGGCVTNNPPERTSTVIMAPAPQAQPAQVAMTAPTPPPPPPPQASLVPPPPQGSGTVVWQPGHWSYTGAGDQPWTWIAGRYVAPPAPNEASWVPGAWQESSNGAWMWNAGHWQ
jgi:WXXGXW repeat (2 copies)